MSENKNLFLTINILMLETCDPLFYTMDEKDRLAWGLLV